MTTSTRTPRTGLALGTLALSVACAGAVLGSAPSAHADVPTCFGEAATIVGEGYIRGTDGPDVIVATGDAEVHSYAGDDRICGAVLAYAGPGDDKIRSVGVSSRSGSEITGGKGDDLIVQAGEGQADIRGGTGDDVIRTGYGVQYVNGGKGDDDIVTGRGDDDVDGRAGDDRIDGGLGDDELRGRVGDDVLDGGRGDDDLQGGGGRDRLAGFFGADTLRGGVRDDRLDGGPGRDSGIGGPGTNTCLRLETQRECGPAGN